MPIYSYRCNDCKHTFEILVKGLNQNKRQVCPECKSTKVSKTFGSFSVRGKGQSNSGSCPTGTCPLG